MNVRFPGQLSIITGETGAGKSIFLEALGLALGNRADLSSLRNRERKCIVEAEFDATELDLRAFFEAQDLEYQDVLSLRREISADGKSRCFINDSLVSLAALKSLAEQLVDVHSQHQTLQLNKGHFQLGLLDAFAANRKLLDQYGALYKENMALKKKLKELEEAEVQSRKDRDYFEFQYNELMETELKQGRLQDLEEKSLALENAGFILQQLHLATEALNGNEQALLAKLGQIRQQLTQLSKYGDLYKDLAGRLESARIELNDIAAELRIQEEQVNVDPEKLLELNGQLDQLNRLLKKHGLSTEEELIRLREDLGARLEAMQSLEGEILAIRKQVEQKDKSLIKLASELSKSRQGVCAEIEKRVRLMLQELGMPSAQFLLKLEELAETGPQGRDAVQVLFSANKGEPAAELHKIASGGELSRLMLCLKALLAEKKNLPCMVFDEIDTGVSGEVADRIGSILNNMGKHMQVISITHLPQIASKGKHHLWVYKKEGEEKTLSHIKELSKEERTVEIAKMLSTGKPTESAIKNALDLLKAN